MTSSPDSLRPPEGSGGMFDGIARRYDLLNRLASLGMDGSWRRALVDGIGPLGPGDHALDLATGTGDVLVHILRRYPGVRATGLDPSSAMMQVARGKVRGPARLVAADAARLPFPDGSFQACTMAFGIRNIPDRLGALREMHRVTGPGGRIGILELCDPRGPVGRIAAFHVHGVVPLLGAALSGSREYRYLSRSIAGFPPPEEFALLVEEAGFTDVSAAPICLGAACIFLAKKEPSP